MKFIKERFCYATPTICGSGYNPRVEHTFEIPVTYQIDTLGLTDDEVEEKFEEWLMTVKPIKFERNENGLYGIKLKAIDTHFDRVVVIRGCQDVKPTKEKKEFERNVNFINELRGVLEKYDASIVTSITPDAENENDHKCIMFKCDDIIFLPKTHSKNGDITAKDL